MKKWIVVFVAVLLLLSFAGPTSSDNGWKINAETIGSVENVAQSVSSWIKNQDLSQEFDELFMQIKDFLQALEQVDDLKNEQGTPAEIPSLGDANEERDAQVSEYESRVVELVNVERTSRDLSPLQSHDRLSDLAEVKSQDMADKNYFSHTSPTYGSPFDMMNEFDFSYRAAGENIAAGQRTPEEVVEGWMNSEGHRKNILNEQFTHIGVGYVEGGSYRTYWTQLFMTPR